MLCKASRSQEAEVPAEDIYFAAVKKRLVKKDWLRKTSIQGHSQELILLDAASVLQSDLVIGSVPVCWSTFARETRSRRMIWLLLRGGRRSLRAVIHQERGPNSRRSFGKRKEEPTNCLKFDQSLGVSVGHEIAFLTAEMDFSLVDVTSDET
jgi:hypothetical protein